MGKKIKFIKAVVEDIDFKAKTVQCAPAFPDKVALPVDKFSLDYNIVVIAPGVSPHRAILEKELNDFGSV
jgi:NADH:ubiquinone reductase (non-electrogenic)